MARLLKIGIMAPVPPFSVEGACNREVFEICLETCLLHPLNPGQFLVLDNATCHKRGRIEELGKGAGCRLLYLPPYSPDLNKLEKSRSWIKTYIRYQLK